MAPKISIFVPVYRESDLLETLLDDLLSDHYENKEIFVIVDEPTLKSLKLADSFRGEVNFVFNGERRGKANALNEAVEKSDGEILLFLDGDVRINPRSKEFLNTLSEEMREAEIIEVKKEIIRDSLAARCVNYEFLGSNATNWLFSHILKRCLGFNGSAFAIKREAFEALGGFRRVISEDLDMGTRAFMKGFRFKYLKDVGVYTKAPSSWREWFKQRKRWGIGTALWLKENFRTLLKAVRRYPKVILPSLLLIFPSLSLLLINLFIPDELYIKALYIPLLLLSTKFSLLLPPMALTSTTLSLIRNLLLSVGSLGVYSSIYYIFARKLEYSFNPLEFTLFYLVYSTLWLLIVIVSIIRVYTVKQEDLNIDWKV